jgi:hypothetical protein
LRLYLKGPDLDPKAALAHTVSRENRHSRLRPFAEISISNYVIGGFNKQFRLKKAGFGHWTRFPRCPLFGDEPLFQISIGRPR